MAIIKFNNRKSSTDARGINQLKRGIEYITDSRKTRPGLIGGIGIDAQNAFMRMTAVKKIYHKPGGRQYVHFIVSFRDKVPESEALDIAGHLALFYDDFQVLYAVHNNTNNVHVHFIINTVNVTDGHKYSQSRRELQQLKNYFQLLCDQRSIDVGNIDIGDDADFELVRGCVDDEDLEPIDFSAGEIPEFKSRYSINPVVFVKDGKIPDSLPFYKEVVTVEGTDGPTTKIVDRAVMFTERTDANNPPPFLEDVWASMMAGNIAPKAPIKPVFFINEINSRNTKESTVMGNNSISSVNTDGEDNHTKS